MSLFELFVPFHAVSFYRKNTAMAQHNLHFYLEAFIVSFLAYSIYCLFTGEAAMLFLFCFFI